MEPSLIWAPGINCSCGVDVLDQLGHRPSPKRVWEQSKLKILLAEISEWSFREQLPGGASLENIAERIKGQVIAILLA